MVEILAAEYLEDKIVDISIGILIGLLILVLHRRADAAVHNLIEEQHSMLESYNQVVNEVSNLAKMIHDNTISQHDILREIHSLNLEESKKEQRQQELIEEIRALIKGKS